MQRRNRLFLSSNYLFAGLMFLTAFAWPAAGQTRDVRPATAGCFRQPVQALRQALTLRANMPLECRQGYAYLDSLCRAASGYRSLDSLLKDMRSWETLQPMMRMLYRMQEYDADLYEEYLRDGALLDKSYAFAPAAFVRKFTQRMRTVLGYRSPHAYMTAAPVIVHIRVLSVGMKDDALLGSAVSPIRRKCITAEVRDKIKGLHLRQSETASHEAGPTINLAYSPMASTLYTTDDYIVLNPVGDGSLNDAAHCEGCYGNDALEEGKEYIVFLEDCYLDSDGQYCYIEYEPCNAYDTEGGIFPIVDGQVGIADDFFGYGTSVAVAAFKSRLSSDIVTLLR